MSIQPRTGLSKFANNWPTVRKNVRQNIGAFAQADGKRMELERELESAKADQEELEELRSQVKDLKTKYAKAQGYQT